MKNPRQRGLFDGYHPKSAHISIKAIHELVQLADVTPWPQLIEEGMGIRASKVKALVGPEPHCRELLGAIALMSVRQITYRQAEDLIANDAPARYLCNLMDSSWSPDYIDETIYRFDIGGFEKSGRQGQRACQVLASVRENQRTKENRRKKVISHDKGAAPAYQGSFIQCREKASREVFDGRRESPWNFVSSGA